MLKKIVTGMLGLAIGLGLAAPAHAETTPAAAGTPGDPSGIGSLIDAVATGQLAHDRIPGAAVVVVRNGRQVFAKGYGVADVATGAPVGAAAFTPGARSYRRRPARSCPPRPRRPW